MSTSHDTTAQHRLSRREAVRTIFGTPLAFSISPLLAQSNSPRSGVVPTPRCFSINGRSVFLVSGSIHYFRVPHQLWRDRLLRAKRAGLNCIQTYVAWNFHEPEEGRYLFDGDHDISKFLALCQELSLYVVVRPGPYIDAEWDAGGYPAWLAGKSGVEFRTMNRVALPYIQRWFEKLIPRIASYQATRGGPVILVQNENEYFFCDRAGGPEYLQFLMSTLRKHGIEVPITDCNGFENLTPGSLKTYNAAGPEFVTQFRRRFPDLPVYISEFWIGPSVQFWGQPLESRPVEEVRRVTLENLALGAMYNFYMFHGGTNFAFWAGNSVQSDHSWITTRYDFTAPIAEGGALNEKYFSVKSANLLASNFQDFFCEAEPVASPVKVAGPIRLMARRSQQGFMLFVLPKHPFRADFKWEVADDIPVRGMIEQQEDNELAVQPGFLRLPSGRTLTLAEGSAYSMMIPFQFQIDAKCRVDFANATMVGCGGGSERRILVFRGEAGYQGVVSVNGRIQEFLFPPEGVSQLKVGTVLVLALSRETADRLWFVDGQIFVGPAFVGERSGDRRECWLDGRETAIEVVSKQGQYDRLKVEPSQIFARETRLRGWINRALPEIEGQGEGWRSIPGPRSVEELGGYYGYTWYQASFFAKRRAGENLFFTGAADRVHVFVNGTKAGIWGRYRATRDPLPVELKTGRNSFVFLCDNMGRNAEGNGQDRKGIWGGVYLGAAARELELVQWDKVAGPPRNETWQFKTYRCRAATARSRFFRVRLQGAHHPGEGASLAFRWVSQYAWIYVNGQFVGEHRGNEGLATGNGFSEFVLDPLLHGDTTQFEVTFFGEPTRTVFEHLHLIAYPLSSTLTSWQFKPFQEPLGSASAAASAPTWWECEFARPDLPTPLFLVTAGLSKGEAYLNGKALGRYWEIGPQRSLYMPEPWVFDHNRMVIFDEEGRLPNQVYIVRDARYPHRKVLL